MSANLSNQTGHILVRKSIVEAEHRLQMLHRLEPLGGTPGDTLRRRVGCDEFGMGRLERLEFLQQRVELGVCDLGVVEHVVALFVVTDQITKLAEALFRRDVRHVETSEDFRVADARGGDTRETPARESIRLRRPGVTVAATGDYARNLERFPEPCSVRLQADVVARLTQDGAASVRRLRLPSSGSGALWPAVARCQHECAARRIASIDRSTSSAVVA